MNYAETLHLIEDTALKSWLEVLPQRIEDGFDHGRWGDLKKWQSILEKLPQIKTSYVDLDADSIVIGKKEDLQRFSPEELEQLLRECHPWRKGPFNIFGIQIETEWRSDMKWDRLKDHIEPLKDRLVLDVGSGNGYHCWRMGGQGAKLAIGIDPTVLYVVQFQIFQKYVNDPRIAVFPIGIDDMPSEMKSFDTAFSMGLLYHRRSPLDHLLQLKSFLREGGQLILETLVIDGAKGEILNPEGRYAKMPNVWFIPSPLTLEAWLKRMGFKNIQLIDVTKTSDEEQRVTDWMGFQSLADFLDPQDSNLTIEGYPAPKRAIFLANA